MNHRLHVILISLFLAACGPGSDSEQPATIDELVEEYLFLELSMGKHDAAHVDAYFENFGSD